VFKFMKALLIITALASLLVGCATSSVHHAEQWEYRVKTNPDRDSPNKNIEPFLNDMAKEGWIFMQRDDSGNFYFKRVTQ